MRTYAGSMLERAISVMRTRGDWMSAMEIGDSLALPNASATSERNALSRALHRGIDGEIVERRQTSRAFGSSWEYRLR